MRVILTEPRTDLTTNAADLLRVPVLSSTLGSVIISAIKSLYPDANIYSNEPSIRHETAPYTSIDSLLSFPEGGDFVIIAPLNTVLSKLDTNALVDKKNVWFALGNNVLMGFFDRTVPHSYDMRKSTDTKNGHIIDINTIYDMDAYMSLVFELQGVVGRQNSSQTIMGGLPIVHEGASLTEGSKVYGPCYIGPFVRLKGATIYPGTYIYGDVTIQKSEIRGSVIIGGGDGETRGTFIDQSTIRESWLYQSKAIRNMNICDSVIAKGSVLIGTNE